MSWVRPCRASMSMTRRATLATFAMGLMSCGGGSSNDEPQAPPGSDPLPLSAGTEWEFDLVTSSGGGTMRVVWRLFDLRAQGDQTTFRLGADASTAVPYLRTPTELRELPFVSEGTPPAWMEPLTVLRFPLTLGDRWTAVDKPVRVDDGNGTAIEWTMRITFHVRSRGVVHTPQGTYRDAYEVVRSEVYQHPSFPQPGTTVTIDWIVPGIGVVRRDTSSIALGGVRPHLYSWALVGYRVRAA
jgi:hypothetical protein